MNKKLWYLIPLLLLVVGLLLPAFLNNRPISQDSPGSVGQPPAAASDSEAVPSSGESLAAEPSSAAEKLNNDGENNTLTAEGTATKPGQLIGGTSATAPAPDLAGQHENVAYTAPASSLAPSGGTNDGNLLTCQLAVVGKGGELLFGPAPVELSPGTPREITALGVLAASGLSYGASNRYPDLIESIAGQRNQGQAGWLYQVNGAVPLVAAGKKSVAAGDKIIWWYSGSISSPSPDWEQLVDQSAGSR